MYARGGSVFSRKKRHPFRWMVGALLALAVFAGVYVVFDSGRVVVRTERVLVPDLPQALEGFTILHITDLGGARFGPDQKVLHSTLKDRKYSAVCLSGNMIGKRGDAAPLIELLAALDTTKPVFFIAGEGDPPPIVSEDSGYFSVFADWIVTLQSRGAVYLDAPASIKLGDAQVWFDDASQLSLDLDTAQAAYATAGTRAGTYYADVITRTKQAREQMKTTDLHISLTHVPLGEEFVLTMQNALDPGRSAFIRSVDLMLAGGMAGGQWRLPFIGPVWAGGWLPGANMPDGLRRVGSVMQYTSRGLGVSPASPLPGIRLFNTPELALITFTSMITDM